METKHYCAKQTLARASNSLFRYIVGFSLISLARASIVDDSYSSHQDLYDAIINTLFPITFVVLLKVSEKRGGGGDNDARSDNTVQSSSIKNKLLPLLDDFLYNIVTWFIPLIVSFAYDDKLASIGEVNNNVYGDNRNNDRYIWSGIFFFLTLFPAMVITTFWAFYLG
ncbi:1858_t:CDS:2 [Paraglomus brasilianum]|uniref:1858_t:CDS:1 n=1 Tax=Paraglomus brasilianum TaxID=144538 RepID=A0A9N9B4Z4_9GLOM|nr:1858_t:CDS:2 [Paraglomus brasilianum]